MIKRADETTTKLFSFLYHFRHLVVFQIQNPLRFRGGQKNYCDSLEN